MHTKYTLYRREQGVLVRVAKGEYSKQGAKRVWSERLLMPWLLPYYIAPVNTRRACA